MEYRHMIINKIYHKYYQTLQLYIKNVKYMLSFTSTILIICLLFIKIISNKYEIQSKLNSAVR